MEKNKNCKQVSVETKAFLDGDVGVKKLAQVAVFLLLFLLQWFLLDFNLGDNHSENRSSFLAEKYEAIQVWGQKSALGELYSLMKQYMRESV